MATRKTVRSATLVMLSMVLSFQTPAAGQTKYHVLHSFGSGTDGGGLWGSVTLDAKGRIYGATSGGGAYNGGTVFRLTQLPNGRWSEKILHGFPDSFNDAGDPNGGLVQGQEGHWYGTSQYGGTFAYGTVFELSHTPSGWQENVLYSFGTQNNDGGQPVSGLVIDGAGNLYGTAPYGGTYNAGTVFELMAMPNGGWNEQVLYSFCPKTDCPDGHTPFAGLIFDASGNLYGTTYTGGAHKVYGTVYQLSPGPGGWQERVLLSFIGLDGVNPGWGSLFMDGAGRLYGTTAGGGGYSAGVVYRLTPQPDGSWKESVLHSFKKDASGFGPNAGVVRDGNGNLYGTTDYGGLGDCGVIYKLSHSPTGKWTYTVLHTFTGSDGCLPEGNLVLDDKGNLYGATALGGAYGAGVVFKLVP